MRGAGNGAGLDARLYAILQARRINQFLGTHYTPEEIDRWEAVEFELIDMAIEEYGRQTKRNGR